MAIAITNKTSGAAESVSGASVDTASVTLADGDYLVVRACQYGGGSSAPGVTTITWNGNTLTEVIGQLGTAGSAGLYSGIWAFQVATGASAVVTIDPAGSVASLSVMWSVDVITGHDTVGTVVDSDSTFADSGNPAALTMTSNNGDLGIDSATYFDMGSAFFSPGAGQTEQFHYGPSNYDSMGASSKAATGASVSMEYTSVGGIRAYVYTGAVIKASGAPPPAGGGGFLPSNYIPLFNAGMNEPRGGMIG